MKSVIERLRTAWKLYRYGMFSIMLNKAMMGYIRYCTFILYSFDLTKEPSPLFLKDPAIEIKRAEHKQDEPFRKFCRKFPAEEFVSRIERQVCYIAFQDNEVIAYAWVALDELFIDAVNHRFTLGKDEIFIHSCYVDERYRGYGIYPGILRRILFDYHQLSFRRAFIGVISENSGSIRGIKKAGFKGCNDIGYVKFINAEKWRFYRNHSLNE